MQLRRKESLCACTRVLHQQSGTGGGGWGHPHSAVVVTYGAVHKAAAVLACEGAMVGTGYKPIFVFAAMDWLRKHYSHF